MNRTLILGLVILTAGCQRQEPAAQKAAEAERYVRFRLQWSR